MIPDREQLSKSIKEQIDKRMDDVNLVVFYFKRIMSLSVLLVIIHSSLYLKTYTQMDDMNNIYITDLFEKVDKKRKSEGMCF